MPAAPNLPVDFYLPTLLRSASSSVPLHAASASTALFLSLWNPVSPETASWRRHHRPRGARDMAYTSHHSNQLPPHPLLHSYTSSSLLSIPEQPRQYITNHCVRSPVFPISCVHYGRRAISPGVVLANQGTSMRCTGTIRSMLSITGLLLEKGAAGEGWDSPMHLGFLRDDGCTGIYLVRALSDGTSYSLSRRLENVTICHVCEALVQSISSRGFGPKAPSCICTTLRTKSIFC